MRQRLRKTCKTQNSWGCLAGESKNWIWSLDFDTSCHHRSGAVTFQTFQASVAQKYWVVTRLMSVTLAASVLQSITECCVVLQSIAEYCKYCRVLQSIAEVLCCDTPHVCNTPRPGRLSFSSRLVTTPILAFKLNTNAMTRHHSTSGLLQFLELTPKGKVYFVQFITFTGFETF